MDTSTQFLKNCRSPFVVLIRKSLILESILIVNVELAIKAVSRISL